MNGIDLHAHGVRSNAEVVSSNAEVVYRNKKTKKLVRKHSFAQNAEDKIKKHASVEAKGVNEAKALAKRMGGMSLRKFSQWLKQKYIRNNSLKSKDARRVK